MTKQDTYQVLGVLRSFYPNVSVASDEDERLRLTLWHEQFANEPGAVVLAAVKAFVATDKKGFMPVPGQIKEQIAIIRDRKEMNEQEAWDRVTNALRNSSYSSVEEFNKLPENIRRAVGSPNILKEWAVLPFTELQTVIASNFKRDYRAIVMQEQDLAKIPETVRLLREAADPALSEGVGSEV